MRIFDPSTMFRGWYVGNFEPTAYRTKEFEVSVMEHRAGEYWAPHYHALSDEINYLLEGRMIICGQELSAPTIFVIERNEVADPTFITDCRLVVIKTPSAPGDKILVTKEMDNEH